MQTLNVPFKDKDDAKSLGARWNSKERLWYVPDGVDFAPFARWLPTSVSKSIVCIAQEDAADLTTGQKGIALSMLLSRIGRAVEMAFASAVWVQAEISEISVRNNNTYLDIVERNAQGIQLAKSRAVIWGKRRSLIEKFCQATGSTLAPGIKVLVSIQPKFSGNYGLSLEIVDIDPVFTMGEMAAKLKRIRELLRKEGIFDKNRQLQEPQDFFTVAVVSPEEAAGLGDFRAEADRLQSLGLCEFQYYAATFQGDAAPESLRKALRIALQAATTKPIDVLVIIRGGGAVADLHWLNDETLARVVATAPIPVFTGIGHERDSTILDEVAKASFDTPSKVIAHIFRMITQTALSGQSAMDETVAAVSRRLLRIEKDVKAYQTQVGDGARRCLDVASVHSREILGHIRHGAEKSLQIALHNAGSLRSDIQSGAKWRPMRVREEADRLIAEIISQSAWRPDADLQSANRLIAEIHTFSSRNIVRSAATAERLIFDISADAKWRPNVSEAEATRLAQYVRSTVANRLDHASKDAASLIEGIITRGPHSTLARGYAIVRDLQGKVLSSASAVSASDKTLTIEFRDATITAQRT